MKPIKYFLLFSVLCGLYYYETSRMFTVETSVHFTIFFPLCVLVGSLVAIMITKSYDRMLLKFCLLSSLIYIQIIIHGLFFPLPAKSSYISLLLPSVLMFFPQSVLENGVKQVFFDCGLMVVFLLLVAFYFYNYQNNILIETDNQNNAAYTILFFAPILLCSRSKYVRYIVLLLTGMSLMYSLKRSGIAAFTIALTAYLYVVVFVNKGFKNKFVLVLLICLGILCCIGFFQSYFGDRGELLMDRFAQLDDGGSGRDEIYKTTIFMISQGNTSELIFGHGYDSVSRLSPLKCSAHNDFLEYFYDYGCIGLIVLISYIVVFCKYTVHLIKNKSQYAAPALFALVLMLVNSTFSHIFFYEWYFLLFVLFFGYLRWNSSKEVSYKM